MLSRLIVAASLLLAGPALANPLVGAVIDVAAGEALDGLPDLARRLRRADVLILGEIHDNPAHHAGQAELVAETAPAALAFEMIPPVAEPMLARLRADGAPAAVLGEALRWEALGWPDFAMYAPIFAAAPKAEITGGAVDGRAMRVAMERGAAEAAAVALGYSARRYDLETPLPAAVRAEATQEQISAHCDAIPAEVAGRMVEAQRLRDAAFSDAVLRARAMVNGARVALITGRGHARVDRGVPTMLEAAVPGLSVVSVGFMEVREGAEDWRDYVDRAAPRHDYLVFTEAAEREDPCVAFRERR